MPIAIQTSATPLPRAEHEWTRGGLAQQAPITSDLPPTLSGRGRRVREPGWSSLSATGGPRGVLADPADGARCHRPAVRAARAPDRGSDVARAVARGRAVARALDGDASPARARAPWAPADRDRADRVRQRRERVLACRAFTPPAAHEAAHQRARADRLRHADLADELPDLRAVVLGARPRRPGASRRRARRAT